MLWVLPADHPLRATRCAGRGQGVSSNCPGDMHRHYRLPCKREETRKRHVGRTCSAKAPQWSGASDPKACHAGLGESIPEAWRVSSLLEKPSVDSCPQGPLFQGNTLVFLPSIARGRRACSRLCSRAAGFLGASHCGVSRCFAHRGSSQSPEGGRASNVRERGCPLDRARQSRDHSCALGSMPFSFVVWNKALCLLGLTFPICEMELLRWTLFTSLSSFKDHANCHLCKFFRDSKTLAPPTPPQFRITKRLLVRQSSTRKDWVGPHVQPGGTRGIGGCL